MSPSEGVLFLSFVALIVTKVADFVTTIRHVGPHAELNPLARRLFLRFGFGGGLAIVGAIWLAIVVATYVVPFWQPDNVYRWLTSGAGFAVSLAQWGAARFNSGAEPGRITRRILRLYQQWARTRRDRG